MADNYRIKQHPILEHIERKEITFSFNNQKLKALDGEVISSALFANGIKIFGHHHKNNAPQGIFCANGQCAQCTVIADGYPVKACIEGVKPDMVISSCEGFPSFNTNMSANDKLRDSTVEELTPDVLIIGGGPAGLAAAIELGKMNLNVLLIDDKHRLGGKLVLQTHNFFGSIDDCYAGTRGIDIATILEKEIYAIPNIQVWINSVAVGVFSDKKIGIVKDNKYFLISPKKLLIATGAREKGLPFNGWEKAGVYGAGAFQTLVNRDLVKSSDRVFIVGGGNVGLIAGYHALQAGMDVVGLVEVLPSVSGYKVHGDKLKRLGVPIYTSHKVLEVFGENEVQAITIAAVNEKFEAIAGTEKTFEVDTVLIAVGLNPVDEFYKDAKEYGMDVFSAGDAQEIAEASAAMFGGKIAGREIARSFGMDVDLPQEWYDKQEILKSRPKMGKPVETKIPEDEKIFPVIRCFEEIPCNPCIDVCRAKAIDILSKKITDLPQYLGGCNGCNKCVASCPALAITLVDRRKDDNMYSVILPFEIIPSFKEGDFITCVDTDANELGQFEVTAIKKAKWQDRRYLVTVKVPKEHAMNVASIKIVNNSVTQPIKVKECCMHDPVLCKCEQVRKSEIEECLNDEIIDLNQIKALTRAGMGACGSKTCSSILKQQIGRQKPLVPFTPRPLFCEVQLETFINK